MATTGVPRRSSSMLSWIHHDVHEPQSAMAAATTSHSAMNSSVNRAGEDASLRNQRKLVTPWRSRRSDSTFSKEHVRVLLVVREEPHRRLRTEGGRARREGRGALLEHRARVHQLVGHLRCLLSCISYERRNMARMSSSMATRAVMGTSAIGARIRSTLLIRLLMLARPDATTYQPCGQSTSRRRMAPCALWGSLVVAVGGAAGENQGWCPHPYRFGLIVIEFGSSTRYSHVTFNTGSCSNGVQACARRAPGIGGCGARDGGWMSTSTEPPGSSELPPPVRGGFPSGTTCTAAPGVRRSGAIPRARRLVLPRGPGPAFPAGLSLAACRPPRNRNLSGEPE